MTPGAASVGFSFLAGSLSILSPCVLPLVPIVVATASARQRMGALALALGLTFSFTAVGLFVATVGFAIGLDADWFRAVAAVLLLVFGVILLSDGLQRRFANAATRWSGLADAWLGKLAIGGLGGQLVVGLLLGMVWAPCVGPTLGAAATLASQGNGLGQVALIMAAFGIGAGLTLGVVGMASRRVFAGARGRLLRVGAYGKSALGAVLVVVGLAILTGWDKALEARLVAWSPAWLTELTTRF